MRNSEVVLSDNGSGYRFNGEGSQVSYRCGAKRVTIVNFDQNKIRDMATELGRKEDEVSAKLDQCIVNIMVDYTLPFEMNDSFDVILLLGTGNHLRPEEVKPVGPRQNLTAHLQKIW